MRKTGLLLLAAMLVASQAFTSALSTAIAEPTSTPPSTRTLGSSSMAPEIVATRGESRIEPTVRTPAADSQGRHLYVVQFQEPSLAAYRGDIDGLAATSPRSTGMRKLDVRTPAARAYREFLRQRHQEHIDRIESVLGRSVELGYRYLNVLNAIAVRLEVDEARRIAQLDVVRAVFIDEEMDLDTDVGPGWIGAPAFWNGDTTSGAATRGEGVIVGIIDSGVQHAHPSFAAVASDGHVHINPYGTGTFVGVCATTPGLCNDKLIGSYVFNGSTPEDESQHGTHVASTAIGNPVTATFRGLTLDISGVAPRANLINYKVCAPGCPQTASAAAVDQAVSDGTDVLNYSISGSDNPWATIIDLAFLDGNEAGISIAVSAGNTGPNAATTTKTGAWVAGFGNFSHDRIIGNHVDAADLTGLTSVFGTGPGIASDLSAPILDAAIEAPDNPLACNAFAADAFDGSVALIQRGGCTFAIKAGNAADAGALFVLLFNNQGGPPTVAGGLESATIPVAMIDLDDGLDLQAAIAGSSDPQATIFAASSIDYRDSWGDVTANTSGRGPSQFDVLKPDFAAPGSNILAAGLAANGNFAMIGGTSMASPHGAGSAALLIAEHGSWSPAQVKSAMALTARSDGLVKQDGTTPSDPFDRGSGMIDLAGAARVGFVLDEQHSNYVAANPAIGGDPRTLNQASLQDRQCPGSCTWQRTITSVLPTAETYVVTTAAPAGMSVDVVPSNFTLDPGASLELSITSVVDTLPIEVWNFAEVTITAQSPEVPVMRMPLAIRGTTPPSAPQIEVDPESLAATVDAGQSSVQSIQITNLGEQTLVWSIGFGDANDSSPLSALAPRPLATITGVSAPAPAATDEDAGIDVSLSEHAVAEPRLRGPSRRQALSAGLLLVPTSNNGAQRVLAFDPISGDLLDENFITYVRPDPNSNLATPKHIILNAAQDGFLIVDQLRHVVSAYDLDGEHLGVFAPAGGADTSIAQNMRSIVYSPEGTLLASVAAGANAHAVAEFDSNGTYLGNYIGNGANGLANPWDIVFRDDDMLVSVSLTGAAGLTTSIFRFDTDGSPAGTFADNVRFTQQLSETAGGTILAAHSFTTTGAPPVGILEFDSNGNLIATLPFDSPRGVIELGNGHLLVSNGSGVHEIDRDGNLVETKISGVSGQHISRVKLGGGGGCDGSAPTWIDVDPDNGSTLGGNSTTVEVTLDSTGLASGSYSAQLCIESNDPAQPVLLVPVQLTVVAAGEGDTDLGMNLFGTPGTVSAGGEVRMLATVANFGPATATDVIVDLILPPEFDFIHGRRIAGAGDWQCSVNDDLVVCELVAGTLPVGSVAAVLEILVGVDIEAADGEVDTQAMVSSADNDDPNPGNNTAVATTTIVAGSVDMIFSNDFECAAGLPDCPKRGTRDPAPVGWVSSR